MPKTYQIAELPPQELILPGGLPEQRLTRSQRKRLHESDVSLSILQDTAENQQQIPSSGDEKKRRLNAVSNTSNTSNTSSTSSTSAVPCAAEIKKEELKEDGFDRVVSVTPSGVGTDSSFFIPKAKDSLSPSGDDWSPDESLTDADLELWLRF